MKKITCAILLGAGISGLGAQPLTLAQAQQQMIARNPDIRIVREQQLKAELATLESKAAWYPSAQAFGTWGWQSEKAGISMNGGPSLEVGDNDRFEMGVSISYPLFTGMSRWYHVKASTLREDIQRLSAQQLTDALSLRLGLSWYQWLLARYQAQAQRELVLALTEHEKRARNLVDAGVDAGVSLLTATARLQAAQLEQLTLSNRADSLKLEIASVAGVATLESTPDTTLPILAPAEGLSGNTRADLQALDKAIEAAAAGRKALVGKRLPWLFMQGTYRYADPGLMMGASSGMDYATLGVNLQWTLFDGFENRAQRKQVDRDQAILEFTRQKQSDQWEKETAQARLALSQSSELFAAARTALDAADGLVRDLDGASDAGIVGTAEYLDALAAAANARYRLYQAGVFESIARLRLAFSIGEPILFR